MVVVGGTVVVVVVVVVVVGGAIVVVVVVVVGGGGEPTIQVMPAGRSAELLENVICTFQNLSCWVADATPSVHAKPRLYVPGGTNDGPSGANTANENDGRFTSRPPPPSVVATAVVWSTNGLPPAEPNNGNRRLAPMPAGTGPLASKVSVLGLTLAGTM